MAKGQARRVYRSPHRRRQVEQTSRRIADAARRLFAERGYGETTIEMVARSAGVATETVFKRYGSKRAVLEAVLHAVVEEADLATGYEAALAERRPAAQLQQVAATVCRLWTHAWDLVEILRRAGWAEADALAIWRRGEDARLARQGPVVRSLATRRALRAGLKRDEAAQVLWALTSPDLFEKLVRERGWTPERYEHWLGDVLGRALLG